MSGCDSLKHIYGKLCLFRILSRVGVGGCDLKQIHGWVYYCRIHLFEDVGVCDCLKHIYGWVYLSRRHLFMGLTI